MKKALYAFGLGTVLCTAHAAEKDLSKQYHACIENAGGSDANMSACLTQETKRQDQRLNKNYQTLISTLQPDRKKQLQAAQRLWIQFRDANCSFYLDPDGGTMARVAASSCAMSMTADRATELESLQ